MKGQGPFTPTLPAPPGVVRRRATQTAASSGSPSGHVGTPMPMRLPGMAAPRSEPASSQDMERIRSRRPSQAPGKQAPATAVADKKQQQDLISSADSWSMTHEREERYRAEIEAQVRQEMAAEEEMRRAIEERVRAEVEEQVRAEQEAHRTQIEERLRREMEMQIIRDMGREMATPAATPTGPSPGPGRKGLMPNKGHARKNSVTNSARELRGLSPAPPRAQSGANLNRRPLPPPPAPKPLSPRTVAAIQIQSCVRRWYARRMLKRLRRRVAAVKEILSTEEQFVQKLRAFQSVFFAAMREAEGQGMLNPSDLAKIVGNWDDVVVYNTELLRQLRGRVGSFNAGCTVGDIFLGMRHFGSIYSAFLAGYDSALSVVMWHQKNNPPMAKLIRACEKQLGNTIESYLILPVQRIPRYVLLLRAVVQETDRAHPDSALCLQAAQKMEAVGTAVNERRREFEAEEQRQLQLRELSAQIAGLKMSSLLDDNRRVVLGPAEVILLDCGEKRTRAFVLLSDLFLLLEPYKSPGFTKQLRALRYRLVKEAVPLREASLSDVTDGSGFLGVVAWNSFLLQWGPANCNSFYLFSKTIEDKKALVAVIQEAIAACKRYQ